MASRAHEAARRRPGIAVRRCQRAPVEALGPALVLSPAGSVLGHGGGERVLGPVPGSAPPAGELLLRHPHQPIGGQVERRVGVLRRLLHLDRLDPGQAQREVALLLSAALAGVDAAELDAKLGGLVTDEAGAGPDEGLLRVLLDARGEPQLFSLEDDFHAANMRPRPPGWNRPELLRRARWSRQAQRACASGSRALTRSGHRAS